MNTIQIIDEQPSFIVVHKPHGIGFHQEDNQPGLFQKVKTQFNLTDLYPVHRLDKITSGIVIFAKTAEAATEFGKLFENKQVEKYYLALAKGKPSKKQGLIKGDMGKARRGAWKLLRSQENPAVTQLLSYGTSCGVRVFLLKPHTGKTHQIRVALKSLGTPLLGDSLYGGETDSIDRAYLHAFGVRFTLFEKSYAYCASPTAGDAFAMPEIETLINDQLSPPWNMAFPKLK